MNQILDEDVKDKSTVIVSPYIGIMIILLSLALLVKCVGYSFNFFYMSYGFIMAVGTYTVIGILGLVAYYFRVFGQSKGITISFLSLFFGVAVNLFFLFFGLSVLIGSSRNIVLFLTHIPWIEVGVFSLILSGLGRNIVLAILKIPVLLFIPIFSIGSFFKTQSFSVAGSTMIFAIIGFLSSSILFFLFNAAKLENKKEAFLLVLAANLFLIAVFIKIQYYPSSSFILNRLLGG